MTQEVFTILVRNCCWDSPGSCYCHQHWHTVVIFSGRMSVILTMRHTEWMRRSINSNYLFISFGDRMHGRIVPIWKIKIITQYGKCVIYVDLRHSTFEIESSLWQLTLFLSPCWISSWISSRHVASNIDRESLVSGLELSLGKLGNYHHDLWQLWWIYLPGSKDCSAVHNRLRHPPCC